jgi:hypothetical protein
MSVLSEAYLNAVESIDMGELSRYNYRDSWLARSRYDRRDSWDQSDATPIEWWENGERHVEELNPMTREQCMEMEYRRDEIQLNPEFVRRVLQAVYMDKDLARKYPLFQEYLRAKGCDPAEWWKKQGEGLLDLWHYPDIWIKHCASGLKVECGGYTQKEAWKKKPQRKDFDRWYNTDEETDSDEYEDSLPNFPEKKMVSTFQPKPYVGPMNFKISNIDWDDWESRKRKPFIRSRNVVQIGVKWSRMKDVCISIWNHLMDRNKVKEIGHGKPPLTTRMRRAYWVYKHRRDRFDLEIFEYRCSECGSEKIFKTPPDVDHFYHSICQECHAYLAKHYYYGRVTSV